MLEAIHLPIPKKGQKKGTKDEEVTQKAKKVKDEEVTEPAVEMTEEQVAAAREEALAKLDKPLEKMKIGELMALLKERGVECKDCRGAEKAVIVNQVLFKSLWLARALSRPPPPPTLTLYTHERERERDRTEVMYGGEGRGRGRDCCNVYHVTCLAYMENDILHIVHHRHALSDIIVHDAMHDVWQHAWLIAPVGVHAAIRARTA